MNTFDPAIFKPTLPDSVLYILQTLQNAGYEGYIVGGCVRDMILCEMGYSLALPNDYDIATSALQQEIMALFPHTIPTGLKYGTISVIIESCSYEVTTFRVDGHYSNARSPDSVYFSTSLLADVNRRDFSINALAYTPHKGLIDMVGGIEDILHKQIVCVGNPMERFSEDALRILRALRFSATLGFGIESHTKAALYECAVSLKKVAKERIRVELSKLLCGAYAQDVLSEYISLFVIMIPQIPPQSDFSVFESLCGCEVRVKWACFLYPCKACADGILRALKFDNKTREYVLALLRLYEMPLGMSAQELKILIANLGGRDKGQNVSGERLISDILMIKAAQKVDRELLEQFREGFNAILDSNLPLSIAELCINGDDLLDRGMRGKRIGEVLQMLLMKVLNEEIEHKRPTLLRYISKLA